MSGNSLSSNGIQEDFGTSQKGLTKTLLGEFGNQTWQFLEDDFLKRIISPRTQTHPGSLAPESFDYDVDKPWFADAFSTACTSARLAKTEVIPTTAEGTTYLPLARLLNRCVSAGLDALNRHAPDRKQSLLKNLVFYEYDAETIDYTNGAARVLKPDIVGVFQEDEVCAEDREATKKLKATAYWGAVPNGKTGHHIEFVCDVKANWRDMVDQLATYARSQFKACPSRTFVLTLAYNHEKSIARFIAFHRSGLTASEEFKLNEASGEKILLRYIMGILLWTEPQHAGFPQCITDERIYLPGKDGKGTILKKHASVYHYICVRGRATYVWEVLPESAPSGTPASSASPAEVDKIAPTKKRKQREAGVARTNNGQQKRPRSQPTSDVLQIPTSEASQSGQSANSDDKGAKRPPILPFYGYELDPTGKYSEIIEIDKGIGVPLIKSSWQPSNHPLAESELLKDAKGQFGVVDIGGQIVVQYAIGEVQSTELLTPTNEEFKNDPKQFFWDIHSMGAPPEVERRVQVLLVMKTKGSSLLGCKSTYEFFICVKHALIGWLNLFMGGCLHRDISIGNILKRERAAEEKVLPFAYPKNFDEVLKVLDGRGEDRSGEDAKLWEELKVAKDAVEKLLKDEYSTVTSHTAFVTDVDQARPTNLLWKDGDKTWEQPSGTVQFMSMDVIESIKLGSKDFLQSPADDLESFFYVALWAIFRNQYTSKDLSPKETHIKSQLLSRKERESGVSGYLKSSENDLTSPLVKQAKKVMKEWHTGLFELCEKMQTRASIHKILANASVDDLWRRSVGWILCALSGVLQIVTIINSHLERLKTCADFDKVNPQ